MSLRKPNKKVFWKNQDKKIDSCSLQTQQESKMHQKRNWNQINQNLVKRGSITLWIDPKVLKTWTQKPKIGRPKFHSDVIRTGLYLKALFRLTFRALQGFLDSILKLMKLPFSSPDYSLFSKRAFEVSAAKISNRRPAHILIDSSGVKIFGEGEWKVRSHGVSKCSVPLFSGQFFF